jgi:hypothetical protein
MLRTLWDGLSTLLGPITDPYAIHDEATMEGMSLPLALPRELRLIATLKVSTLTSTPLPVLATHLLSS